MVGLLSSRIPGPSVSVCVTLSCPSELQDRPLVLCLVVWLSFMCVSSSWVLVLVACVCSCDDGRFSRLVSIGLCLRRRQLAMVPLSIATDRKTRRPRNAWSRLWCVSRRGVTLAILLLPRIMWFDLGRQMFETTPNSAAPFVLPGLTIDMTLFVWMWKSILPMVPTLLKVTFSFLMDRRLSTCFLFGLFRRLRVVVFCVGRLRLVLLLDLVLLVCTW